jgi:tetratricopeptide (TPR) repeat protein
VTPFAPPQSGSTAPGISASRPSRLARAHALGGAKVSGAVISAIALIYSLFAGIRTVGDPDLGWQMATGRWIIQHRAIPYTDVLSYTAHGKEWVYPVLSQLIFYLLYRLGGYSLLSWFTAAACVGATALLLRRSNTITKSLTVVAVPIIAFRIAPRAELFTELLFAAFVSILWHYHKSGRGPLYSLPLLMLLWVNLHLGYLSGLGMCAAYVFLELGDAMDGGRRQAALIRLRTAAPWLLATLGATLLNAWWAQNYIGMWRLVPVHSSRWVVELMSVPVNASTAAQAVLWRDPRSAIWWLMLAAFVALLLSLLQLRPAPAVLFGISLYLVIHAMRFAGPFAIVAVIIGGSILGDGAKIGWLGRAWQRVRDAVPGSWTKPMVVGLLFVLTAFAGVRIWDLVTCRYYLRTPFHFATFGTGESWWYPEDAAAFVKRERLPANLFNDYNLGGFVTWRLGPEYSDYIDGRGAPFGDSVFFRSLELLDGTLDTPAWQREAAARDINTVFVSVDLEFGGALNNLGQFCRSQGWRPVYLDTRAAVFVRVSPETAGLITRLQLDCNNVHFDAPPTATGLRGRTEQYIYHRNAGAILVALGQNSEALQQLDLAERAFPAGDSYSHYYRALALLYTGRKVEGEQELRAALAIEPSDYAAKSLAILCAQYGHYAEAASILGQAVKRSGQPYPLYLELGFVQLDMDQPEQALLSFDKAEKGSPFVGEAAPLGAAFNARLAEGRASARRKLAERYQAPGLQGKPTVDLSITHKLSSDHDAELDIG